MTQRSQNNARNQARLKHGEGLKGVARKSSASAKPVRSAGASVYTRTAKAEKAKKSKLEKSVDEDATKKKRNQDRRREQALASQLNDLPEYKKWRRIWWAVLIVAVVACVASFAVSQMRTTGQIPTDVADAVAPVTLVLGYGGIIAALVIDLVKIRGMRKELEAQAHTMSKAQLRKLDASIEASDRAYEEEREKRKSRRPWNKKKDQAADAEADEK